MSSGHGLRDTRISRCHNFIAYTIYSHENGVLHLHLCVDLTISNLTIKRANILDDILQQAGVVPAKPMERDLKVHIQWERVSFLAVSTKVALVIPALDMVVIYDIRRDSPVGPMIISQSPAEGIHRVQWIPPPNEQTAVSDVVGEGAYVNSKQLLIFTKNELSVKLFSLDGEHVLLHIYKPQCGRAFFRAPDYRIWLVISRTMEYNSHPVIYHFLNTGSLSVLILHQRLQFLLLLTQPQVAWSPEGVWFSVFCDSDNVAGYRLQMEGATNFSAADKTLTPLLLLKADTRDDKYALLSSTYAATWLIPENHLPGYEKENGLPAKNGDRDGQPHPENARGLSVDRSHAAETYIVASVCDRKRVLRIVQVSTHTPRQPRVFTIDVKSIRDCTPFRQRQARNEITYSSNNFVSSIDFGSIISIDAAGDFLCVRLDTGIFILRKNGGGAGYRASVVVAPTLKIRATQLVSVKSRIHLVVTCADHVVLCNLHTLRIHVFLGKNAVFHAEMGRNHHAGMLVVYTSGGIEFCPLSSDDDAEESFVISRFKRKFDHHSFNSDITDTFGRKKNK